MLKLWYVQAIIIGVLASLVLNGAPFLPWFRDIQPRRIEARWVGYVGLTSAFGLWLLLGKDRPAWQAVVAWVIIMLLTLIPNTVLHLHDRNTDDSGELATMSFRLTKTGKALLHNGHRGHPPLEITAGEGQKGDTAEERWLDAMAPWMGMLNEFDIALACLVRAVEEKPEPWLLTTIANLVEMRGDICRARANAQLWYGAFWPQYAR
jgi:hypothetical protein